MYKDMKESMRGYTIHGLKSFMHHDGMAFTATVKKDGKKVAVVHQEGMGGPTDFVWASDEAKKEFLIASKAYDPKYGDDGEVFIGHLCDTHESLQKIKNAAKTKTLVVLNSDGPNEYRVFKTVYTPEVGRKIRERYKEDLKCIINEEILAAA